MKTIITSNSRPLRRALFYTLLLGIAALWAMPRSARAQLYVSQFGSGPGNTGIVGEYYTSTGAAISSFTPITGLNEPYGLAVLGNDLFVANITTLSFPPGIFTLQVGEYNATTGVAINATESGSVTTVAGTATVTFTTPFSQIPTVTCTVLPAGVAKPTSQTTTGFVVNSVGNVTVNWVATGGTGGITAGPPPAWVFLAVSGNNLFVTNYTGTTVSEYNATTGAPNPHFSITGLSATALAVSGNNLFVANAGTTVSKYYATTGAPNPHFSITGLSATGLAVSGNNLFVANAGNGTVGVYNATTGAVINANLITGLTLGVSTGLAVSGNNLFVANFTSTSADTSTVSEYDVSTNPATLIKANFITGLSGLVGLAVAGTATRAHPVNFHEVMYMSDDGLLVTYYEWESSSGNLADIADCSVGELVTYPGPNTGMDCPTESPECPVGTPSTVDMPCYSWPFPWLNDTPNPTIKWHPGNCQVPPLNEKDPNMGSLVDHQLPGRTPWPALLLWIEKGFPAESFTAKQTFRFCCPGMGIVNFQGYSDIPITRNITHSFPWTYTIDKQGEKTKPKLLPLLRQYPSPPPCAPTPTPPPGDAD